MDAEILRELARHQAWADAAHWKALRDNPALLEDAEILKRLNHIHGALKMLSTLARGETPDMTTMQQEIASPDELEKAMTAANTSMTAQLDTADLQKMIPLPRGPNGPWTSPAWVLLLQAITHGQHHRGQNVSRMRQLGVTPPMTDYVIWVASGRP